MSYGQATFRILIDNLVQVEVSIKGCDHTGQSTTQDQLRQAGRTIDRIGRAIEKVQKTSDRERGKRAAQAV